MTDILNYFLLVKEGEKEDLAALEGLLAKAQRAR